MKVILKCKYVLTFLVFLCSSWNILFSQNDIRINNSSSYLGNGKWSWKVYIIATNVTLSQIASVTYTLHKTFSPNRISINRIGDENYPFALSATGWGTFTIKVEVKFRNGQSKYFNYPLVFKASSAQYAITTCNTSKEVSSDWWSWTVYISSSEEVLNKIKCVEYTLHESFTNPVQLICLKGSNTMAFPFSAKGWGTFEIKIKVIYSDGSTQNLHHELKFQNKVNCYNFP